MPTEHPTEMRQFFRPLGWIVASRFWRWDKIFNYQRKNDVSTTILRARIRISTRAFNFFHFSRPSVFWFYKFVTCSKNLGISRRWRITYLRTGKVSWSPIASFLFEPKKCFCFFSKFTWTFFIFRTISDKIWSSSTPFQKYDRLKLLTLPRRRSTRFAPISGSLKSVTQLTACPVKTKTKRRRLAPLLRVLNQNVSLSSLKFTFGSSNQ